MRKRESTQSECELPMFEALTNKIKLEYGQKGIRGVLKKAGAKVIRLLFDTTCSDWYELSLARPVVVLPAKIELQLVYLDDNKNTLIDWLKVKKKNFSWICYEKEIESAIKNNHIYIVAKHAGEIVGYLKIGIGPTYIHDFDETITFPPGVAFITDTFVLPECRGQNIALSVISSAAQHLREKGFSGIFCHIERWNVSSIKAFEKIGFNPWGSIRFVRIMFISLYIKRGFLLASNLNKTISNRADLLLKNIES